MSSASRRQLRDRERRDRRREHDRRLDDLAATAPSVQQPFGHQRSDETPLTGDALEGHGGRAGEGPGGTIVRVETDADGHAKYEAHMTDATATRSPCT